jgi:pimeloyl-ACP methyl ester carboxylesterase
VVVCVHGAADRGAAFARVGRSLPGVDLVRFDRRGYGRSQPLEAGAGSLDAQVADVVGVVDWALGQHGGSVPVVVCGHSHGGLLALGAALADHRVSGVVAWEPPMPWAPWWSSGRQAAGAAARTVTSAEGDDPAGDTMESFLRRMIGDERWEALPLSVRATRRAEGPALLADLAAARAAGTLPLGDVGVPVVLGLGGATAERHRRAIAELATVFGEVEVVEVPGADHGAHLTHPAAVADAVLRCLAMVGQRG